MEVKYRVHDMKIAFGYQNGNCSIYFTYIQFASVEILSKSRSSNQKRRQMDRQ